MTWTIPDSVESHEQFDIDFDRIVYDPEYRNEVKSVLASSDAEVTWSSGCEAE